MARHKSTIACDISPRVRRIVTERDEGKCIVCGTMMGIQIAHYRPRSQLGMGIPENLACMCFRCHADYDQGGLRKVIGDIFREYLQSRYEGWNEDALIYRKGMQ